MAVGPHRQNIIDRALMSHSAFQLELAYTVNWKSIKPVHTHMYLAPDFWPVTAKKLMCELTPLETIVLG